jgi:hypothetical protein
LLLAALAACGGNQAEDCRPFSDAEDLAVEDGAGGASEGRTDESALGGAGGAGVGGVSGDAATRGSAGPSDL